MTYPPPAGPHPITVALFPTHASWRTQSNGSTLKEVPLEGLCPQEHPVDIVKTAICYQPFSIGRTGPHLCFICAIASKH
jgi:hypothetical protein